MDAIADHGPVLGTALFGSRARGDHAPGSDIDVLLWTDREHASSQRVGMTSLSFYPRSQLLEQAAAGELFAAHLVHEAVPLCDPLGFLVELRASYRPTKVPRMIVGTATDLGDFLLAYGRSFADPSILNRRVAWVVRTILTARAVELGRFLFAVGELTKLLDCPEAYPLVEAKDFQCFRPGTLEALDVFLKRFGERRGPPPANLRAFRDLFEHTGNRFALKTLRTSGAPGTEPEYA